MKQYAKCDQILRPRFSIRTLLVLTALVAAACYWWVARPTIVAERFAAAIERGDYAAAEGLFGPGPLVDSEFQPPLNNRLRLTSRIEPRTWQDLLHGRRRIDVQYAKGSVVIVPNLPYPAGTNWRPRTPCPCASLAATPGGISPFSNLVSDFPQFFFFEDGIAVESQAMD